MEIINSYYSTETTSKVRVRACRSAPAVLLRPWISAGEWHWRRLDVIIGTQVVAKVVVPFRLRPHSFQNGPIQVWRLVFGHSVELSPGRHLCYESVDRWDSFCVHLHKELAGGNEHSSLFLPYRVVDLVPLLVKHLDHSDFFELACVGSPAQLFINTAVLHLL